MVHQQIQSEWARFEWGKLPKLFLVLQQKTTSNKHSKLDIIMDLHKNSTHTKVNPNIHMTNGNTLILDLHV